MLERDFWKMALVFSPAITLLLDKESGSHAPFSACSKADV
jgi:hypothetical protein